MCKYFKYRLKFVGYFEDVKVLWDSVDMLFVFEIFLRIYLYWSIVVLLGILLFVFVFLLCELCLVLWGI